MSEEKKKEESIDINNIIKKLEWHYKDKKVPIDVLKYLFRIYKSRAITEEDIMDSDITQLFWLSIISKLKNRELNRISVIGEVRTGKSTVASAIKEKMNQFIVDFGYRKDKPDPLKTIVMDQTEFLRYSKTESNCCVQIDEWSALGEGGANATTEQQLLQVKGDMFAKQYLHTISCNPTRMTDTNCFIILEVDGKQIKEGYTKCLLRYKDTINNESMYLGCIYIQVWDIIKNWEKHVRHLFETKKIKTKKDIKYIKDWAKKDWYVAYNIKKDLRLKLIDDHGIRDVRDLEFSTVVLAVFKDLKDIATTEKVSQELLITTVQDVCREQGKIYSWYAETVVLTKVKSVLGLLTRMCKYEVQLDKEHLPKLKRDNLIKAYNRTKEKFQSRLNQEGRLVLLYDQYLNVTI